ncbi:MULTISPECIES: DMT family transporter [Janibacter]|uniref:Small multidrug resistance pump n=1 Tax=Janibacter indicus TaxID=857417 RepID=A0A1W1Z9K6_9MICO|nr:MULTISPECIES: SMR family transporter [Janibacter]QNF94834.1 QacE family quaternary ammonium compound efflux SMR transporter [Janibacter sp. YB324]SMC45109.1 small multidrug resistance pump [Janibacter indicus]
MTTWLLLAAAIVCEVAATLSLKAALDRPVLYAVVVAGYVASFGLLAVALRRGMPLGIAYGIWSACGVALTTLLSTLLLDETFTPLMGLGVVLVIGGVLLVETGAPHEPEASP